MIKELAARIQRVKPSPTLAVSARADELIATGKNIINFGIGEPDFDTPDFVKEAAIKAIRDGFTKYTAVDGFPALKKAIVNKFARENRLQYEPGQIIVSCGAKHSFYNLFVATLNPGDEVIIPAPYWVSYPDMAKMNDAIPVILKADIDQQFKITPQQLEAAITSETRIVILNSPSNPSGLAYSVAELKALAQVLLKYPNILVATDDIYEHTLWSKEPFHNILMVCPELNDRCVVINGVSKAYAMTGWRIGYAGGPAKVIAAMKKAQSQSTSNPCSVSQVAAEAALDGDQACIKTMTQAYKERHDYILGEVGKISGVQCLSGDGTFYNFILVEEVIKRAANISNDIELSEYLLNEAGVAVVPGSAFGTPGYIRLSFATSMEKIVEGMKRIKETFGKL